MTTFWFGVYIVNKSMLQGKKNRWTFSAYFQDGFSHSFGILLPSVAAHFNTGLVTAVYMRNKTKRIVLFIAQNRMFFGLTIWRIERFAAGFLIFGCPCFCTTNIFLYFVWLLRTPLRLIIIWLRLIYLSCLLLIKAAGPCFMLAEIFFPNLRHLFWSLTNPMYTLLGVSKTRAANNKL